MTVNQRFEHFLLSKKISQTFFADLIGMDKANVSNIAGGRTKQPKSDFFEGIALNYPDWLFWILTGDDRHYPTAGGEGLVARDSGERPPYGLAAEVERLLRIVEQQSHALESLTGLVEALREEVRVLREKLAEK
jgi:transcriptional regulator with XRE-family HTH domain